MQKRGVAIESYQHLLSTSTSPQTPELMYMGLGRRLLYISLGLLVLVGVVTFEVVNRGQDQVIEYQARELADVVARIAASARSVYATKVVGKLKKDGYGSHIDYDHKPGYVPLPAQFLKYVGLRASEDSTGLYWYKPVSKWNLEAGQGLKDDFQRWAWSQLESQDQMDPAVPIAWKTVWRVEDVNGRRTLRYLRADPAVGTSCVECHNQYELRPEIKQRRLEAGLQPGKQWKLNQLLGAIEVDIPLDNVKALAKDQTRLTLMLIIGVVIVGLVFIGVLVFMDIARARTMARHLSWHATHDLLTGLSNRGEFEERLNQLIRRAHQDSSEHALLFIDLDQFKLVNDACGHVAGDELLRQIAVELQSSLRKRDTLARLGGDEFGVLLEDCTLDDAQDMAEKLRRVIKDYRFVWDHKTFEVAASMGLLSVTNNSDNVASIMSAADLACYAAKDNGRNRVHVATLSDTELQHRRTEIEWASRITKAMKDGRMHLAVQKVVANNKLLSPQVYQEVLLRMESEDGGYCNTNEVIYAAERYNLMPSIDRWVVSTVCRLMSQGHIEAHDNQIVAINLSGNSLNDRSFLEDVIHELKRYKNISPFHICFEITETSAIRNLTKATVFIRTLKKMGCRFALDDFGSGISSFGYLKNLSVDFLKIDGEFVKDMESDPFDRAMIESTVKIAKVMNIPTVAEWVENETTLNSITQLDVDYSQGFHVSKPVIIDASCGDSTAKVTDEFDNNVALGGSS